MHALCPLQVGLSKINFLTWTQIVYLNAIPSKGDNKGKGRFQLSVSTTYIILLTYMLCVAVNLMVGQAWGRPEGIRRSRSGC